MRPYPEDIFTESDDINPDTLAALGPLARMAGTWEGGVGTDTSPKADGPERKPYTERIELEPIDPQSNGPQLLYGLRYHLKINTPEEETTFHDQVGYWLYEPATGQVIQTVAIPRGQVAIASGQAAPDAKRMVLTAKRGETAYGICSNPFLEEAFRTESYRIEVVFNDDGTWSYTLETVLMVRGQAEPFVHRDVNTLSRVAPPRPNPLMG
jgi:hypothetical protein